MLSRNSLFLLGATFALITTPAVGFELQPGAPFPTLTLPTAKDGSALSTESLRGKKSLVHIFGSW
jgi:hypothetical protein